MFQHRIFSRMQTDHQLSANDFFKKLYIITYQLYYFMSRVTKHRKSLTSAFLSNDLLGSTHYTEHNSFILKTILIFLSFTRYCFCQHISNFITVLARYLWLTHLSASKPDTSSGAGSLLYRSSLAHSPFQRNHKIKCNWMCYTYSGSWDCFL